MAFEPSTRNRVAFEPSTRIRVAFEPSARMAFMPSEVSADEPSTSMADEPSESKAVEPSKVPEMIGGEVYVGEGAGLSAVHPGHVGIDWQTENSLHGGRSRLSCSAQVGIDWNIGEVETWTVQGKYAEKALADGIGYRYGKVEWYEMIHK